jgi:hypothetical protein
MMDLFDGAAHFVFLYVIARNRNCAEKNFQVKKRILFLSSGFWIDLKKQIKRSSFSHKNAENNIYSQIENSNPSLSNA